MDLSATRKGRGNQFPQVVRSVRRPLAAPVCLITGLLFAGFAVLGAAQPQVQAPSLKVVPSSGPSGTAISIIGEDFTSSVVRFPEVHGLQSVGVSGHDFNRPSIGQEIPRSLVARCGHTLRIRAGEHVGSTDVRLHSE